MGSIIFFLKKTKHFLKNGGVSWSHYYYHASAPDCVTMLGRHNFYDSWLVIRLMSHASHHLYPPTVPYTIRVRNVDFSQLQYVNMSSLTHKHDRTSVLCIYYIYHGFKIFAAQARKGYKWFIKCVFLELFFLSNGLCCLSND